MNMERKGVIQFKGHDVTVIGSDVEIGQQAPDFSAHTTEWLWADKVLESTKGNVRIVGSLPSLNTSVCDRETRRFNQEAASLGNDVVIIMLSMDLPYTQKNWCAAAEVDRVMVLSDHKNAEFGEKYGVLLKEPRILRRAIFVVDRDGKVVYADYMPAIGDEPKYEEVLE